MTLAELLKVSLLAYNTAGVTLLLTLIFKGTTRLTNKREIEEVYSIYGTPPNRIRRKTQTKRPKNP